MNYDLGFNNMDLFKQIIPCVNVYTRLNFNKGQIKQKLFLVLQLLYDNMFFGLHVILFAVYARIVQLHSICILSKFGTI